MKELSRCSAGDEEPKLDEKELALGGRRRLLRHPWCHLAPAGGDEELSEEPDAAEAEECRGITHTPISNTHTHTHTLTLKYIYTHIYTHTHTLFSNISDSQRVGVCVCVCVCVCG